MYICMRTLHFSQATAVMDSFKSSFQQALNSSPSAMCDSCPLKQLHLLCQNLEGTSCVCVCVCVIVSMRMYVCVHLDSLYVEYSINPAINLVHINWVCGYVCVCICFCPQLFVLFKYIAVCVCAGVPTPVAQSRIQQCLSQLSEADYNCIMSEYKVGYSVYFCSSYKSFISGIHSDMHVVCLMLALTMNF